MTWSVDRKQRRVLTLDLFSLRCLLHIEVNVYRDTSTFKAGTQGWSSKHKRHLQMPAPSPHFRGHHSYSLIHSSEPLSPRARMRSQGTQTEKGLVLKLKPGTIQHGEVKRRGKSWQKLLRKTWGGRKKATGAHHIYQEERVSTEAGQLCPTLQKSAKTEKLLLTKREDIHWVWWRQQC